LGQRTFGRVELKAEHREKRSIGLAPGKAAIDRQLSNDPAASSRPVLVRRDLPGE
jgi:hypothetical protein